MIVLDRTPESLTLQLQAALYSEEVVFKCFYWYGDKYSVWISLAEDNTSYTVILRAIDGSQDIARWSDLERRITRDLIDFKTRDLIAKETQVIRELLVAKAFAHSDEFDSSPPGSVTDPVGFHPEEYGRPR